MYFRIVTAVFVVACLAIPARAEGLVSKMSPHSVAVTIDRLAAAIENAGARVFVRVDHAAGAEAAGMELRPTEMIMFGNPKLGTPALQAAQGAGLDLPLRAVAYEDEGGRVHLVYHDPRILAATHGIPTDAEVLARMATALDNLTDAAVAE